MDKEERAKRLKEKEDTYYSLRNKLDSIKWDIRNINQNKQRSNAFKMLNIAIDLSLEQVNKDYNRYVRRIRISDMSDDVSFMQKALNREKLKNAELEKKIEEAKTSSGLFIDFVRSKLGMK
ncbi:MAG TPA: hypothetical protein EYN67_01230 [Flavobacteriales bacterium]|nr:hypothetical protein [Flavobacteriales bacterium]